MNIIFGLESQFADERAAGGAEKPGTPNAVMPRRSAATPGSA